MQPHQQRRLHIGVLVPQGPLEQSVCQGRQPVPVAHHPVGQRPGKGPLAGIVEGREGGFERIGQTAPFLHQQAQGAYGGEAGHVGGVFHRFATWTTILPEKSMPCRTFCGSGP